MTCAYVPGVWATTAVHAGPPAVEARHATSSPTGKEASRKASATPASTPRQISVGFSPGEAQLLVLTTIESAQRSIDLAAYAFTSPAVVDALRKAVHRHVRVRLLVDAKENLRGERSKNARAALVTLVTAGATVRSNDHYAIHHNKFMVVDGRHVQTGSFNYTQAAAKRNAENVIVIWGDERVAARYRLEFERLWAEGAGVGAEALSR